MTSETGEACAICGLAMDANRAICNQCGRTFHLALRVDQNATDCGDAWIDEDVQALVFGCNSCLGQMPEQPPAAPEPHRHVRRTGVSAKTVARTRRRTEKN